MAIKNRYFHRAFRTALRFAWSVFRSFAGSLTPGTLREPYIRCECPPVALRRSRAAGIFGCAPCRATLARCSARLRALASLQVRYAHPYRMEMPYCAPPSATLARCSARSHRSAPSSHYVRGALPLPLTKCSLSFNLARACGAQPSGHRASVTLRGHGARNHPGATRHPSKGGE